VAYLVRTTAGDITEYTSVDSDIGSPSCVGGHLGYLMFGYGNGDIQSSDLNDTNLNTLNKARTESNPDGVSRIISYNGQMYVFGEKTVEVWGDPVNTSGFPLTRIGFNIVPGLKAPFAIAGYSPEFGNPFIWVGNDNTVRQLNGYSAEKVSTPDLDRLIAGVVTPDTNLRACCYVAGGVAFWELTSTDETEWTWVYNLSNKTWHERKANLLDRSQFKCSVPAFGEWLVGSSETTDLMAIDHTLHEEAGEPLTAVIESGPVKDFPNRQRITRADFDFTPGVGLATGTDPMQTDPSVLIEVSQDGGYSWPVSWVRKLGRQAETSWRTYVLNAGLAGDEGARWRLTVSDAVHVGLTGGSMETEVQKK
jgi:hypothetical protein